AGIGARRNLAGGEDRALHRLARADRGVELPLAVATVVPTQRRAHDVRLRGGDAGAHLVATEEPAALGRLGGADAGGEEQCQGQTDDLRSHDSTSVFLGNRAAVRSASGRGPTRLPDRPASPPGREAVRAGVVPEKVQARPSVTVAPL